MDILGIEHMVQSESHSRRIEIGQESRSILIHWHWRQIHLWDIFGVGHGQKSGASVEHIGRSDLGDIGIEQNSRIWTQTDRSIGTGKT